jgi:hypothetical protein
MPCRRAAEEAQAVRRLPLRRLRLLQLRLL